MIRERSMVQRFLEVVMSRKNIFEFVCQLITLAILCAGLVGCGSVQPLSTPTSTPSVASTALPTLTNAPPTITMTVIPGPFLLPPPGTPYDPTPWPTWTPLPDPLPKFSWDGYVLTFIKDGDLYFQDGNNQPAKLTHVGEKSYHGNISDDNKKIFFSRNDGNSYSINADGTHEQVVISKDWQSSHKTAIYRGFIPRTHLLLEEVLFCESEKWGSPCSMSLFIADTDTGEIRKLTDAGLAYQKNHIDKNIVPSPDGTMIAVGTTEGTDIISVDGELIRENILPYKPILEYTLLPSIFWLPDSSGITIAIPDSEYDSIAYKRPAYSIWRYSLADNLLVQTPIDPSHITQQFDISPDGRWIVHGGVSNAEVPLYLGDLTTGQSQIFGAEQQSYFSWGPASKYFAYGVSLINMATVDDPLSAMIICGLVQWIDANHFICLNIENNASRIRMAEIVTGSIKIYDLGFDKAYEFTVSIMPK